MIAELFLLKIFEKLEHCCDIELFEDEKSQQI